jgi:excisionase family DNA binding protein
VTVTTTLEGLAMTDMPGRDPDVLTTAELATKLGLSPQTVRRMANARQIPALKTGKDFRYSWGAVREVLRHPHHQPGDGADDPRDTEASKKEPATAPSGALGSAPQTPSRTAAVTSRPARQQAVRRSHHPRSASR